MGLGTQIAKIPHDVCGTKDALTVFVQEDGSIDGWCFRCNTFVRHPYGEDKKLTDYPVKKKKTPEQIEAEIAEVGSYPTVDVPDRKLKGTVLSEFGAKTSMSEQDGVTPTAIYWPVKKNGKLTGYHVKILDTKEGKPKAYNVGDTQDCDLLNWDQAKTSGAYRLIITEGPEDMASVHRIYQMHDTSNGEYTPAVVSLPHGAGSAKHYIQKHSKDILETFKEVVLCFDKDEAGERATKEALLILPEARTVNLPFKDANECLMKGVAKAAYNQLRFHTTSMKNTSLVWANTLHLIAREPAQYGQLTHPFSKLNDLTRGIRYGETIYTGAGVKMGKTELRDEYIAHFIREHDAKVLVAGFEDGSTKKTYKKVAGKAVSRQFHDPDQEFDYEAFDRAGIVLENNLVLVDIFQAVKWELLKRDVIAAAEWGVKAVFVDPITNFTNGMDAGSANTMLQGLAQDFSILARDLEIALFLYCHLKEPEGNISKDARAAAYKNNKFIGLGNCPHEYGGDVLSAQFAGSRGMMRSCNYMIGLEGNKDPDLPEEIRNIRQLKILEDREFGEAGIVPIYWNKISGRFKEM